MNRGSFRLIATLLMAATASCSGYTPTPTVPPDATTAVVDFYDIYCPTSNEEAENAYNRAVVLARQGEEQEAERLYLRAIELDPGFCDAMDNLGQLVRRQGRVDEAVSWYMRSIEILPTNPVPHQLLAAAYRLQGKADKAIAEFELFVQLEPDDPEGYYGLGTIYLDLGQPDEATSQLLEAMQLYESASSPLVVDAEFALGLAYIGLDNYETAKGYFGSVLAQLPDHPEANYFMGLCHLRSPTINCAQARKHLARARELGVEVPEDVWEMCGD